jgi:hypothetical protein
MNVSKYANHWKDKHRHQGGKTAVDRARVRKLYHWSLKVGDGLTRYKNPIKFAKGRRFNLGKGAFAKIVSGGLSSLGKRR